MWQVLGLWAAIVTTYTFRFDRPYVVEATSMNEIYKIVDPEIKVIKTLPSSLGRIDYFMVLFEKSSSKEYFPSVNQELGEAWSDMPDYQVAIRVDDDDFELPIFVLHARGICRSEEPKAFQQLNDGEECFNKNVTSFDSAITLHCVSFRDKSGVTSIRTGFHYFQAGDSKPDSGPTSWDSMVDIYEQDFKEINVESKLFWKEYNVQSRVWSRICQERT